MGLRNFGFMKRKYYLIGFAVFIALLIGYHFWAASQAEAQIDKAIQQQSEKSEALSVQYSGIEVSPFAATVSIRDLTVMLGHHIERTQHLELDMSYFDFLNIYFGGLRYGLKNLTQANVSLLSPSYVNRSGLQEIKSDSLHITYTGQALDGLLSAVNGTSFTHPHNIEARSSNLTVSLPKTTFTKLTTREFRYSGSIESQQQSFWRNGTHHFGMDSLTWTPSESFQKKYSFFIKGFGYPTDAIPFQSAQLHVNQVPQNNMLRIESTLKSELALLSGAGFIALEKPLGNSDLVKTKISLTKLSEPLQNVITNIERLFSISLPKSSDGITVQIDGTLSNPRLAK